jgi:urease accessory protein
MAAIPLVADPAPAAGAATGWDARLELRFAREASRTVLAERRHAGPLRVQKPLYPEGEDVCQVVIVHPPGGIAGGDTLAIAIDAGPRAHAQVTTPGAAKWYRAPAQRARAETMIRARTGALVEWLPQESLFFDGARAAIRMRVELAHDARFIGWDVTHLGRTASGERFASGRLQQSVELVHEDALVWCERTVLEGGSAALQSGAVLNGMPAFGTLLAAGADVDDTVLAACKGVRADRDCAVTRVPRALIARCRGDSAGAVRMYFAKLWHLLRPAFGAREAVAPRIWNT